MPAKFFPTRGHLLVCQNVNCRSRGADLLYAGLKRTLENDRLAYYRSGGSVRFTTSGCLGACSHGPVMACYRERDGQLEQAWYEHVDFPLAMKVAHAVHEGADLPAERRYGPPEPAPQEPVADG